MSKYSEYPKRQRERDEMEAKLRTQDIELRRAIKDMDGWADRVMSAILTPLEDNLEKYPLGHKIPHLGQGHRTKI